MATPMLFNTTIYANSCSLVIPGENLWRLTSQINDCVNFIASELEECCSVIDTCCSCHPIIITTLPYDIVLPGYYVLKSDFTYNAIGTTPAISIDADHVVLDLCSHSLSQLQTNVSSGVNGIQINPNHKSLSRNS
jgi:hypothetical protein